MTSVVTTGSRRRRRTRSGPHPVDVHVGNRVRARRVLQGMSQEKLGEAVGLTFQQIQKYERGANRISASRLYEFTKLLDVPITYFFEGIDDTFSHSQTPALGQESHENATNRQAPNILDKSETLQLVRAYYRISDPKVRSMLRSLVKACAGEADNTEADR